MWDAQSGELMHILEGHIKPVKEVACSPDGDNIVSGSDDNTLRAWDAQSGKYICGIYVEGSIYDCQWQPNGNRIVAGGAAGLYFLKFVE